MSSLRLRRRSLLALAGVGLTSGCIRQFESAVSRDEQQPLSVQIKTVPADADAAATKLARYLATRLQQVGIGATVVPMSREELLRSVLLNHDFDMYVYRLPLQSDPDFLRPLFHSRYAPDSGWLNPFGYGDLSLDELLERQRTEHGTVRTSTLAEIQHRLVENQPFTPVAVPDSAWASRPDRVEWPDDAPHHRVSSYLAAQPAELDAVTTDAEPTTVSPGADTDDSATPTTNTSLDATTNTSTPPTTTSPTSTTQNRLRMTLTDARPTENLNPLSTPFRADGTVTRLIYDSLGRTLDGTVRPWMASSWSWHDGDSTAVSVTLREDLEWHDGEPITAADVTFTFDFLSDTALGSLDQPVPSPRYRDRTSLVDTVTTESSREVTLEFADVTESVASRALTVPVLPKHVWEQYARPTSVPWLDGGRLTEALVRNNLDPVGSGPLQVTGTALRESLSMEPFESHFLSTGTVGESLAAFEGGFSFDALDFRIVPSDGATVELLSNGTVDASANSLSSGAAANAREDTEIAVEYGQSQWCYHVGYNHRRPPFTHPRFRRAVARLVDRPFLVDPMFDGDATPVMSPLATTQYAPESEQWAAARDELRFVGERGTGTVDVDRAQSMFEDAGYTYSVDGDLLIQE